ncbi:MAG: NAD(P)/FAD-dependent oxidoreductase [Bacteroidota bacterium]
MAKTVIIIGAGPAGPAGLTAGYEFLKKSDVVPIIFETTNEIGGISKTYNHNGNRMDMGGHRFFSKSEKVMNWWLDILPLQGKPSIDDIILKREKEFSKIENAPDPEKEDKVMLVRNRISRIFYLRKFFDYPISLSLSTLNNLGLLRIFKIIYGYAYIKIFPIKSDKSLEDFIINRFGKELYQTFFKDYTEKVWGVPPNKIQPTWGSQRIKGVSVSKIIIHAVNKIFKTNKSSIDQKNTETSLIEQFIYPKFGPGHLWQEVAKEIEGMGGKIFLNHEVIGLEKNEGKIIEAVIYDRTEDKRITVQGDYFISSMPVKDLIKSLNIEDSAVKHVASGLVYRNLITVGLLLKKIKLINKTKVATINNIVPDLWIYIQEKDVKIGRLQIFNNWSPYLVKDFKDTIWIGLEYFSNEDDELWNMKDDEFISFAINELEKISIIDKNDVLDSCRVKVPKAYPAYFGTYDKFHLIKDYVDKIDNLFLIGRNGTHRYNNMDHSMLSAMEAVGNILNNKLSKDNIWAVNAEEDYQEEK